MWKSEKRQQLIRQDKICCESDEIVSGVDSGSIDSSERSCSPPLEGGEAPCDFVLDNSSFAQGVQRGVSDSLHLLEALKTSRQDELDFNIKGDAFGPETASGQAFISALEKELVPRNTFTHNFLQSIITSLDSRDPVVANAWLETLLDVIDLLPRDVIIENILNVAVSKGQISQPVYSKLSCCKMLGKISTKFEPYLIKKEILPLVQSLCQDADYEVRACMCRQLDLVARGMGLDAAKGTILPELVDLANDEEAFVRLAGIETVVNLLPLLDDETCTHTIIPLVKKFCQNSLTNEDSTLPVISHNLGKLCHGLSVNLSFEQKQWFVDYFRQLCKLGLPKSCGNNQDVEYLEVNPMPDLVPLVDGRNKCSECRQNCAYNFPAMVLFIGPQHFSSSLNKTFSDLCTDPHFYIRKTIASGFHEIAKLLVPNVAVIQPDFVYILNDESIEVLKGLIPHLPDTLETFAVIEGESSEPKLFNSEEIISALIGCELVVSKSSNWRLHSTYLDKLSCLTRCLSSDVIFDNFVPLFLKKLHTARAIPCRTAAAKTLLTFVKHNRCQEERYEVCNALIRDLRHGRSCYSRSLFIDVCFIVLETFSKYFFKKYFLKELLGLAYDKVINVRLRLCAILPQVKKVMKLPTDHELLQSLESHVRQLMTNEDDKDVAAAVRTAIVELDKIELFVESMHSSQAYIVDDVEDLKMEEDEKRIETMFAKKKNPMTPTRRKIGGKIPVWKPANVSPKLVASADDADKRTPSGDSKLCMSPVLKAKSKGSPTKTNKNKEERSSCCFSVSKETSPVNDARRKSTGSVSRIPSPPSHHVIRYQSCESINNSRIPSPIPRMSNFAADSQQVSEKRSSSVENESFGRDGIVIPSSVAESCARPQTGVVTSSSQQKQKQKSPEHSSRIPAPSVRKKENNGKKSDERT